MISLPEIEAPEVTWSAHYSSAAKGLVGGDWYDVIDLDERVGFAIGDIVGRGLEAAVAMGQVRSATRALANCFDKTDEVVGGLDHFASQTGCGQDSSMVLMTIERRSGLVSWSVAGHPPPLLLLPDGSAGWLDKASDGLLGRGGPRRSTSQVVEPGSTIILYTDGLVERRGETLDEGLQRLVEAAPTVVAEDRSNPARRLAALAVSTEAVDDDLAVVIVTYLGV
jgi:serine phosphatase RsbU (regulator of sigma subunit)